MTDNINNISKLVEFYLNQYFVKMYIPAMTEPGPSVHLYARLEARGDYHQGVHSVPQHKVTISPY